MAKGFKLTKDTPYRIRLVQKKTNGVSKHLNRDYMYEVILLNKPDISSRNHDLKALHEEFNRRITIEYEERMALENLERLALENQEHKALENQDQ